MTTTTTEMYAIVFDRPADDTSASHVARLPVPTPGRDEIAIAVGFAGINFKDVMARRGDAGYVPGWPFVPGLEVAGTVTALGADVTGFALGDAVVALTNAGGLAEIAVARAALSVAVPDHVDLARAAAVPGALTTAVLLLDDVARVRPGDAVLVHSAAGAVGRAVAQLASLRVGIDLFGCVGAASRTDAAHAAGYNYVAVRGERLADEVRSATDGRGVDVVLDPQGTAWLDHDLDALAPGGRIVLFGNAGGAMLDPLPPTGRLYGANASVGGFSLAALSAAAPQRVARAMSVALGHLGAGRVDVDVTVLDGLDGAPAAQQALAEGRGAGKYVVRVAA
jgi:NADPH2:quinone reductase